MDGGVEDDAGGAAGEDDPLLALGATGKWIRRQVRH